MSQRPEFEPLVLLYSRRTATVVTIASADSSKSRGGGRGYASPYPLDSILAPLSRYCIRSNRKQNTHTPEQTDVPSVAVRNGRARGATVVVLSLPQSIKLKRFRHGVV